MERMKLLFAYDGSACANDAIADLKRAGLPAIADLLIVSVAEVWVQEVESDEDGGDGGTIVHPATMSAHAREGLDRAGIFARHAATAIGRDFPAWTISTRVYPESPAWGVLRAADEYKPDLIILGSHGRSALGRVFIGSVSQKVLSEALCPVRIARGHQAVEGSPVRLVVGVDGTPDSEAAVRAIASRSWPAGSSVKVVAAVGPIDLPVGPALSYDVTQWVEQGSARAWEMMENAAKGAVGVLRDAGLLADLVVRDGAAATMILQEAGSTGADCIFLGARGHRFMERFLLGSVSSAVAVRAHCSVEVVRSANEESKRG